MQANVGRGRISHNLALQLANKNNADVVLIQEPWIYRDLTSKQSATHHNYDIFSPLSTWDTRPRVLTYIKKSQGYRPFQSTIDSSPDILKITITNRNNQKLNIWNVYNAPTNSINAGDGLSALLNSSDNPFFIGGDFNLKHPSWDSSNPSASPKATDLINWTAERNLSLLNPTNIPTHRAGGTLDLAFCSQLGATCTIRTDLHTTSDHETLLSLIPCGRNGIPTSKGRFRYDSRDENLFLSLLGDSQNIPRIISPTEVDYEANDITQIIQTALAGSCPRKNNHNLGTAWWNEECKLAARRYYIARRKGRSEEEKSQLRTAVRHAKKNFWQNKVDKVQSLTDAYKILKWHNCGPKYQTPPLRGASGNADVLSPESKIDLFRSTLLSRHLGIDDIQESIPTVARRNIAWDPISEPEAFNATCQIPSTSPGIDEITAQVIRSAWPILGKRITNLFDQCVKLGVHPKTFKQANIIILSKPGKRDHTLPTSYRPIALLSCLGKGLERLIARRISYCAQKFNILAQNQCGAVSRRSAVDLTTALICDVKSALGSGKIAGIVTVDVKGAFDGVLCNRLLYRLRTQGWPEIMISWVHSFFQDRTAKIQFDQTTSSPFPILCGLPQGSPVSPILFLLYVEPFLRLSRGRFGYADDGCLLATARTLEECGQKLRDKLNQTLQWGQENGIIFDSAKTELQFFHTKRKYFEPSLQIGNDIVKPNDYTRWLGIFLDRKLNFKEHIGRACQRSRVVTDHVKRLCNTVRGTNTLLLRKAIQGSALATLFYGSETWYGPKTSDWVLNQVQYAINRAARAVLPVYKTTPVAALLRETGWGPAITWLDRSRDRLAARIAAADPKHPLRRRWNSPHFQWIRERQDLELCEDIQRPPWEQIDRSAAKLEINAVGRDNGILDFSNWVATQEHKLLDLTVYSDGSVNKDGLAGAAYCLFRGPHSEIAHGLVPLGRTAEVYDAEIHGALEGLRAAINHTMAKYATDVTICLDNEEAALRLYTGIATSSSSGQIAEFQLLRRQWESRNFSMVAAAGRVNIRWVPSHSKIRGNERADTLAKTACNMHTNRTQASTAKARHLIAERYEIGITTYWHKKAPERYKRLEIVMTGKPPPELGFMSRKNLGLLLAARSGHGNFASYHNRFKHVGADTSCSCGQDRSPEHPFYCKKLQRKRPPRPPSSTGPNDDIKWTLGTVKGAKVFEKWCSEAKPYD